MVDLVCHQACRAAGQEVASIACRLSRLNAFALTLFLFLSARDIRVNAFSRDAGEMGDGRWGSNGDDGWNGGGGWRRPCHGITTPSLHPSHSSAMSSRRLTSPSHHCTDA